MKKINLKFIKKNKETTEPKEKKKKKKIKVKNIASKIVVYSMLILMVVSVLVGILAI